MNAYTGKILFVDLTEGKINEESIDDKVYEKFMSGVGLGAYICYSRIPENADPLGPDNIIGFVNGLLTGTGTLFAGRWLAVGKSPLTGTWGDANCGGTFSPAIKQCGYDGIFLKGISEKPVYLYVDNAGAELRDASSTWGKDAVEAEEILIKESTAKKKPSVVTIGQAGEKLSLISGISNDRGRLAARSGLGAVMGSKKLKGIVLAGSRKMPCHNSDAVKQLSKTCFHDHVATSKIPSFMPGWMFRFFGILIGKMKSAQLNDGIMSIGLNKRWGTIAMNQMSVEMGDAPVKNWKGTRFDFGKKLSKNVNPDRIIEREKQKYHCYACPVGCGGICEIKGKFKETHKPEYETSTSIGGLLLNNDLDTIFYLNELLNRAGMDTISVGGTVGYAIECYENGILTKEDTDGLELTWGNSEAIKTLIEKMIKREGIGDILADGVKVAAQKIGKGSEEFAVHAGGQELGMHDPRNDPGFGVHYSVEPTPGRHTIGAQMFYDMYRLWDKIKDLPEIPKKFTKDSKYVANEDKAQSAVATSLIKQVLDGAGGCFFALTMNVTRFPIFEYLNAATGWDKTPEAYMELGRNIQTLKQMFNVRQGIDPWSLKLSDRAYGLKPQDEGPNKGRTLNIEKMMKDYWRAIGWNPETGVPTDEAVRKLELN